MIKLNSLTLTGPKENFNVDFTYGLNFISGPMATGKSTILEMINYCFGSKSHKDYIEVRSKCTEAILDVTINSKNILIERILFDFRAPVKVYEWSDELNKHSNLFKLFSAVGLQDDNSLSQYLLAQLGWPPILVHGHPLSFRDVYKYCYVSQDQMGTENLLSENSGVQGVRRKPTLEFILEFLDNFTHELKEEKKQRENELTKFHLQRKAIIDFLEATKSLKGHEVTSKSQELENNILLLKEKITDLRSKGVVHEPESEKLELELQNDRKLILEIQGSLKENDNFLSKLKLLRNQYNSEYEKINFIIESHGVLEKIDFVNCPACMKPLNPTNEHTCYLCGDPLTELSIEELQAYKGEKRRLNNKTKQIAEFIGEKERKSRDSQSQLLTLIAKKNQISDKLVMLRKNYVSPILEELELLNQNYGQLVAERKSLNDLRRVTDEFSIISDEVSRKEHELSELRKRIINAESERKEKDYLLDELSKIFGYILEQFRFPKLSGAYIHPKSYLPYVRGSKYNQLGSGGASTLIHIAYMLSIAILSLKEGLAHPGLIIFDTIGKNLGASSSQEGDVEFKDELILRNVVDSMLEICRRYKNLQIIVTNNGAPLNLPKENLVIEFGGNEDSDLPYGLII
jgi:hypothetical protein